MNGSQFTDYYRVLGVHRHAEPAVIDAAYRAMSRRYHPDAYGTNHQQRLLNEAYAALRDPTQRARYDLLWDARHAPFDPERTQRIVREAMRASAPPPPAPPPPPPRRGLPGFIKVGILAILVVFGFAAFKEFSNEADSGSVAQSGADTRRSTATSTSLPTPTPTATLAPTPDPTQVLWEQKQEECRDWNSWIDRIAEVHAFADSAQATYEALPYTGAREYQSFAEKSRVISKRFLSTNPPPAARGFTDASAGYFAALAAALEIDADGGDSRAKWAEADRHFGLAEQELERANNACSGWRVD